MKKPSKRIAVLAAGTLCVYTTAISVSAEYLPGQIKAPTNFFVFEDSTGKYLCYQNTFSTYTIGTEVENYTLYPQIDWYDGVWHESDEWDNANTYERKYNIVGDKISDISGCLRIADETGAIFNGNESLPEKVRVRYIAELKLPDKDELTVEISGWSEEVTLADLDHVSLDNCEIPAPSIREVNKFAPGNYKVGVEGSEGFYMLYGLPNYRLVMYIEAKTSNADWTNIMSTMIFNPAEDITVAIPEGIGLDTNEEPSFRCKYGIEYNGKTIYSAWSNVGNDGVAVEDSEFISNGDVEFVPAERSEKTDDGAGKQLEPAEEAAKESQKVETSNKAIIIEVAAGVALVAAAVIGYKLVKKKKK